MPGLSADPAALCTDETLLRAMRLRGLSNALKVAGVAGADQVTACFGESIACVLDRKGFGCLYATTPDVLERLDEVEAWFAARRTGEVVLELAPVPAHDALMAALAERGYWHRRCQAILGMALPQSPPPRPPVGAVAVRPMRQDEEAEVARMVAVGFQRTPDPETLDRVIREHRAGFHTLVACIDDRPVAMGTFSVHDDAGYFGRATTLPEARGRGCQQALLAARLRLAAELDLTFLAVDARINSTSQRNCQRAGFTLLGYLSSFAKRID